MTLEEIAWELYGLPQTEFIAARDARAKELRASDRDLAGEVKALRKPSVAAWAVNLLARERNELLDQVLELGVSLRQAQAGLQGDELRALTRQRRQLVNAVVNEVRSLAANAGTKLTDAVARQVEDTLTAAMVDESAAAAVHSGTLTEALASTGLGSLAVGKVVGVLPRPGRLTPVKPPPDDTAEREAATKRLEQASSLLADAEARLEKAAAKKSERAARTLQLQSELDELRHRADELEHQLDRAADELDHAEREHTKALSRRDEAKAEAMDAARAAAEFR
jgi:hypothetical protein